MPAIYKRDPTAMPRGVSNRRAALNWIRLNHDINDSDAVIYFGDDDNTFHLDLFKEIRTTKKISMFPVGLVGEYGVSSPIIDKVSNTTHSIHIICVTQSRIYNLEGFHKKKNQKISKKIIKKVISVNSSKCLVKIPTF